MQTLRRQWIANAVTGLLLTPLGLPIASQLYAQRVNDQIRHSQHPWTEVGVQVFTLGMLFVPFAGEARGASLSGDVGGLSSRVTGVVDVGRAADDGMTNVYRFHDASDPTSLQSRFASADAATQARTMYRLGLPNGVQRLANAHMEGFVEGSPFVSVTTNPAAATSTTDPWLQSIAADAPKLSEFRVPTERLIAPAGSNSLSISEGEMFWHGDDLADYLVGTRPNPFRVAS